MAVSAVIVLGDQIRRHIDELTLEQWFLSYVGQCLNCILLLFSYQSLDIAYLLCHSVQYICMKHEFKLLCLTILSWESQTRRVSYKWRKICKKSLMFISTLQN